MHRGAHGSGSRRTVDGVRDEEPVLRVVRGTPTAEELAALVAVLLPRIRIGRTALVPQGPSPWMLSARPGASAGGMPVSPGAHAWRRSALPGQR